MCRTLGIKPLHHVCFELISVAESKPTVLGFWAKQQKDKFLKLHKLFMPGLESTSPADSSSFRAAPAPSRAILHWLHSTFTVQCPRKAGGTPCRLNTRDKFREQLIKGQGTPSDFSARVQLISGRGRKTLYLCWQNEPHDSKQHHWESTCD